MKEYEVKMVFTAYLRATGDSEAEAIENAMDKAAEKYGAEAYDFANFTIVEKEEASE